MESNIGITGAHGFIGKYLTSELDILGISYIKFSGNLLCNEDVNSFFSHNNIHQIIHLVGSFEEPFDSQLRLNFETTKNILEIGMQYGLKKIIYTSTGAVYGEPLQEESFENDLCFPNTFYGLSKKMTEDLILYYTKNLYLQSIILRFPNVYGEGNGKGVIYNFKNSIEKNKKILLYGNGEQSRNFLHVFDAVQGIVKSLYYDKSSILNISNPLKISLNQLIEEFHKKYAFEIEHLPGNNNLKNLLLNIDKAKKEIGFNPKYTDLIL